MSKVRVELRNVYRENSNLASGNAAAAEEGRAAPAASAGPEAARGRDIAVPVMAAPRRQEGRTVRRRLSLEEAAAAKAACGAQRGRPAIASTAGAGATNGVNRCR